MTCRVARVLQDPPRIDLISCSECGSSDLEVCYASNTLGPAPVPGLRPNHGRMRTVGGSPDKVALVGATSRLKR
jgi:hypothetical protein